MNAIEPIRCTLAAHGVEVVTVRGVDGEHVTTVNGAIDGERFTTAGDPDAQHERACRLVRGRVRRRRRRPKDFA